MKAITSAKQCFESDNVIITKIHSGYKDKVRIDARTRYHQADQDDFFSKWVSLDYANKLSMETYGKKVTQLNAY